MKKSKFCRALIVLVLGILPAALLTAAEPSPSPPAQQDGMPALEKMAQFLAKTQNFSVTIREGYDVVQDSGQKIEFGAIRKLLVNRPDHLRIDVEKSGGEKNLIIFDGKTISVYNENQKIYATAPEEGTLDDAIRYAVSGLGLKVPLAMMLVSNALQAEFAPLPACDDKRGNTKRNLRGDFPGISSSPQKSPVVRSYASDGCRTG